MRDYYRILGIRPDATRAEIKEAWNFSVKAFHPDKFAGSSQLQQTVAQDRTKAINEAYEVLSDPTKRASYDREYAREGRTRAGASPPPPPSPPPPSGARRPSYTTSSSSSRRPTPPRKPSFDFQWVQRGVFRMTVVACVLVGALSILFTPKPTLQDFRWRPATEVERADAENWALSHQNEKQTGHLTDEQGGKLLGVYAIQQWGKVLKDHYAFLPYEYAFRYYFLPFAIGACAIWAAYAIVRYVIVGYIVRGFGNK